MWRTFRFLHYKINAKVYEMPSKFGVQELPQISKLEVFSFKKRVFNYDRGFDFSELTPRAYKAIIKFLEWVI